MTDLEIDIEKDQYNEDKLLQFLGFSKSDIPRFSCIYIGTIYDWMSCSDDRYEDSIFYEKMIMIETKTGGYNSEAYCMENSKLFKHPKFITAFNYNDDLIYMRFFFRIKNE